MWFKYLTKIPLNKSNIGRNTIRKTKKNIGLYAKNGLTHIQRKSTNIFKELRKNVNRSIRVILLTES